MQSMSTGSRRHVTPSLIIDESQEEAVKVDDNGVFTVRNEETARIVLFSKGLSGCCVEDRLVVAMGGEPTCHH